MVAKQILAEMKMQVLVDSRKVNEPIDAILFGNKSNWTYSDSLYNDDN